MPTSTHLSLKTDPDHYSILTPISHPGCIRYPLVSLTAPWACAADSNVTKKDLAPELGLGWDEGTDRAEGSGAALENPGYLCVLVRSFLWAGRMMSWGVTVIFSAWRADAALGIRCEFGFIGLSPLFEGNFGF